MFFRFASAFLTLCIIFAASISTSHAAKIYRWVDENGMPHYSQNPPRELQSEKINVQASGVGTASTSNVNAIKAREEAKAKKDEPQEEKEEGLTAEHSPEDKAKYCQQSQTLLKQMSENTNRRFKQNDGSYRKLSQEEIANYRSQAQEGISNYCQ